MGETLCMKLLVSMITLSLFSIFNNVHSQTLKGKVLNESGFAAANVTVKFTNESNSITTQKDGTFKITATHLPDTLVFSAPGFESYKVIITKKNIADPDFSVVLLNKRTEIEAFRKDDEIKKRKSEDVIALGALAMSVDSKTAGVASTYAESYGASMKIRGSSSRVYASKSITKNSTTYAGFLMGKKLVLTDSVIKQDGKMYATRLLTAGEVNDFKKWKLWEDYTEKEFKEFANLWNITMKERYTVELQSNAHYPLVGESVFLIHKYTKDTIWHAITDNTGKAELWANTQKNSQASEYYISINGTQTIKNPYKFQEGINRLTLNKPCTTNNTVEIAFVVDATGSMGDEIEYLKLELEEVINKTFQQYNNLDVRAASVFYRDRGDEYVTKFVQFNNDLLKVLNFIKLQKAAGGGDMPEAVDAALATAIDSLKWSTNTRAKILFLILDAPPHLSESNKLNNLIQKAANQGIRVVPIVCSGADKQTEFLMRTIALATNGTYLFLTNDSGIGNEHIKPTTDYFSVELLNNLLPRIIEQMIFVQDCNNATQPDFSFRNQDNILKIKISPNPTKGNISIVTTKPLRDIFITDFTGKILTRLNMVEKQTTWSLNIQHYPSGTYLVKYATSDNTWGTEKIILMH